MHTIPSRRPDAARVRNSNALAARVRALRPFAAASATFISAASAAFICFAMLAGVPARAAEPEIPPTIEVTAEAEAKVTPDLAVLEFGVTTRADTAAAAASQNATRMKSVLAAVKQVLPKAQIGTGTYALRPEHAAPRDGSPPRVTGYTASNVVRLETSELARIGDVIDSAIKAGANQVQRITFSLADPTAPRRRALRDAVLEARSEAEAIAAALEVKLGGVHSVVEQDTGPVRPYMQDAMMARAEGAATTPIEPGLVSVRARVLIRFRIER